MIAVVILAAGSSSRLGRPKQNLVYNGQTLLQRAVLNAQLVTSHVLVMLGANIEVVAPKVAHLKVNYLHNANWPEGVASSIKLSVKHLLTSDQDIDEIIFTLCDQPHVDITLLKQLQAAARASTKGIIASEYAGTIGVPVLFKKQYFIHLQKLKGKEGAKKILELYAEDVLAVPFPFGDVDIDTDLDFQKLINLQ